MADDRTYGGCGAWLLAATLGALLCTPAAAAGDPNAVRFQGKLLDASLDPRQGSFDFTFRIYAAQTGGSSLWEEHQFGVPVSNGVFSTALGSVVPLTHSIFSGTSAYLEIQVGTEDPMSPRQQLLSAPVAFRGLTADDVQSGDPDYIQNTQSLQSGAVFNVSSGTVAGPFQAAGTSSFTAVGGQTYSIVASSGVRLLAGTLRVEGSGGVVVVDGVSAATVAASSGLLLPQSAASTIEGSVRWEPALNLLYIGTGTSNKTMADTDSAQTLSYKTFYSTAGNLVDATRLQTRDIATDAPSNGMALRWDASTSKWTPAYSANITVLSTPFTPNANRTLTRNTIFLTPVVIPGALTLNQIRFRVTTAQAGVTGDVGLYDDSGNLVASGGSGNASFATAGAVIVAVQGAPKMILSGQYHAAITCTGGGADPAVRGITLGAAGVYKGLGTLAGGSAALPSSITLSSVADGTEAFWMSFNK